RCRGGANRKNPVAFVSASSADIRSCGRLRHGPEQTCPPGRSQACRTGRPRRYPVGGGVSARKGEPGVAIRRSGEKWQAGISCGRRGFWHHVGRQEFLAANVVPKTPTNNLPGTIVTRAVVVEKDEGKWSELLRCDEHLKNQKGFLGMTPLAAVTGWRLQYEQSEDKGLELYFTPLKGVTDSHVLPIGVRWNPGTKRYQSLDRTYEHFLLESPSLDTARSSLR